MLQTFTATGISFVIISRAFSDLRRLPDSARSSSRVASLARRRSRDSIDSEHGSADYRREIAHFTPNLPRRFQQRTFYVSYLPTILRRVSSESLFEFGSADEERRSRSRRSIGERKWQRVWYVSSYAVETEEVLSASGKSKACFQESHGSAVKLFMAMRN